MVGDSQSGVESGRSAAGFSQVQVIRRSIFTDDVIETEEPAMSVGTGSHIPERDFYLKDFSYKEI